MWSARSLWVLCGSLWFFVVLCDKSHDRENIAAHVEWDSAGIGHGLGTQKNTVRGQYDDVEWVWHVSRLEKLSPAAPAAPASCGVRNIPPTTPNRVLPIIQLRNAFFLTSVPVSVRRRFRLFSRKARHLWFLC